MNHGIPSQIVLGVAKVEIDGGSTGAFEGCCQNLSNDCQEVWSQRSHFPLLAADSVIFAVKKLTSEKSEPNCDITISSKLRSAKYLMLSIIFLFPDEPIPSLGQM